MCNWWRERAPRPDAIRDFALEHIPERAAAPKEIVIVDKMPLTDVDKPAKVELRHDAARRAFREVLAGVRRTASSRSTSWPTRSKATWRRSIVAAAPDARSGVEETISERMKAFATSYTVQWAESTPNAALVCLIPRRRSQHTGDNKHDPREE